MHCYLCIANSPTTVSYFRLCIQIIFSSIIKNITRHKNKDNADNARAPVHEPRPHTRTVAPELDEMLVEGADYVLY